MYKYLPAVEKTELIKRYKAGEGISGLCREANISRTIFYKWLKIYDSAKATDKKDVLIAKNPRGKNHWRKISLIKEHEIVKLALKNPTFSPLKISELVDVSSFCIWKTLKKYSLNTQQNREVYLYQHGAKLVEEVPTDNRVTMMRRFEAGESVSVICRDFKISRTIFYQWLKRYQESAPESRREALLSRHPKEAKHWRFVPGATEAVLNIVSTLPKLSVHKISRQLPLADGKPMLSSFGVYRILKKLHLNTYSERLNYAGSRIELPEPIFTPAEDIVLPKSLAFSKFLSVIPPPFREKVAVFLAGYISLLFGSLHLVVFLSSILISIAGFVFIKTILQAGSFAESIGMVFATIALTVGTFFFLYSLKYYITTAIVLSFSQQGADIGGSEAAGMKRGIVSWFLGISGGRGTKKIGHQGPVGLEPNLDNVHLQRNPMVSVQIPLYNERFVASRAITAAINLDYPNFEVIIADDSTDTTTNIIQEYQKKLGKVIKLQGDGFTLTTVEVRSGVYLKHLHRTSRSGYKGGALALATKYMDPGVEFISIFDADFVPYPDSLQLFLKYFKLQNNMSEDYKLSNIAVVQGYQWHVLNKSENWITRGVRTEYAGSYVVERAGTELYGGLKMISGSVYMMRREALETVGWGTSITEDFELTLKLYEKGYKVVYTPYIQAPAECVSTLKRLIRQRMRWAEGHSFNTKLMFKKLMWSDKLTTAEKSEFLYLTPYYLQAFFFLIGTFSWLLSEVIFQVRLPFWTSLWGWSLVLTNLIALPLVNIVGLFLEESEEKDYLGILSFLALCYIVVPFQAYAALKGFMEKDEGTWFRTPKSGRVTDTIIRGKFYRLITGIFGKQQSKPASALNMSFGHRLSPYLSLSSANNRFDNFGVKRKGARWIGKSVLAVVLILAILLNAFSFDPNLGNSVKNRAGQLGLTNNDDLEIKSPDTFSVAQTPTFTIKTPEPRATEWFRKIFFPQEAGAADSWMKAIIVDSSKQEVKDLKPKIEYIDGDYKISLPGVLTSNLKPGKYTLKASWKDTRGVVHQSQQDFNWGVLAINPNKSIYAPGEEAKLGFGVLDDTGRTLCDAKLILEITDPLGRKTELSDINGQIKPSGKCQVTSVTNIADYLAYFKAEQIGKYKLHLIAQTGNGSKSLDDSFDVKDIKDIPFEIERTSYPTRIYPPAEYPVSLQVKANQDFTGEVKDTLPGVFEVKCALDSTNCQVKEENGQKKIIWNVSFKKGDKLDFSYTIKFPNKSPEFYLVGPLKIKSSVVSRQSSDSLIADRSDKIGSILKTDSLFTESRQWQIASDVVTTKFIEAGLDATDGTQFYGYTSGTITQDQSIKKTGRGSMKFDTTGSNIISYINATNTISVTGARISAYFYYASAMAAATGIECLWDATASNEVVCIEISSSGVLRLVDGNGNQLGSTGSTLSTGTWYRLDLSYTITSTTVYELRLFVNGGSVDISVTNGGTLTSIAPATVIIGLWYGAGASRTMNVDDVFIDDSTALTDTGDIRVTAKLPITENTTAFDTAVGNARSSTDYNNVNERPLSLTNGWRDATSSTPGAVENYGIQDADTGDVPMSQNTVVARSAWVWANRQTNAGCTVATVATLFNNGSESNITLTGSYLLFSNIVTSATYPTDVAAVGMRAIDGTCDTYFFEGGMLIAFIGDPVPEAALIAGPLALFAPKIIKSIRNHTFKTDMADLIKKIFGFLKRMMYRITGWERLIKRKQGRRRRRKFNDDS